ncbi:hypothetical protein ACVWZV_009121 [Bradyrhizobium sp. GM5.1]
MVCNIRRRGEAIAACSVNVTLSPGTISDKGQVICHVNQTDLFAAAFLRHIEGFTEDIFGSS